jgi:hypothetical protein
MRGQTLGALVQMLRRELGIAESPALGRNVRERHIAALNSAQTRIYMAHDWPYRIIYRDILGKKAQRYYAPPPDMDLENLRYTEVLISTLWQPLKRGISFHQYNQINSDTGMQMDYVRRWDIYNDPATYGDMIEFWPVPATDNYSKIRFHGTRRLRQLVNDGDVADVDDWAITLTAAADLAGPQLRGAAQSKADKHVFMLARDLNNSETFISGGGRDPNIERYRPPQIVIAQ